VCSLPAIQIQGNYFTHHSVQIFKILCGGSDAARFDPPHKIVRYWSYYSTWLSRSFPPEQNGQSEMICRSYVPARKGQIGWAEP